MLTQQCSSRTPPSDDNHKLYPGGLALFLFVARQRTSLVCAAFFLKKNHSRHVSKKYMCVVKRHIMLYK
jgi:hypothetical protein